jgi:hypothetical protein
MLRRLLWLGLVLFATRAGAATIDDVVGHYVGSWTNNTFVGSTGDVTIDLAIAGSQLTGTFAIGGSILGGFVQPDPLQLVGTIAGGDATFNSSPSAIYGTVAGTIHGSTGALDFALSGLQNTDILGVAVNGTIVNHVMDLTYDVTIMSFGVAHGVLHAPEAGAAAGEAAAGGALLALASLARRARR